jgi:hypothetical protein
MRETPPQVMLAAEQQRRITGASTSLCTRKLLLVELIVHFVVVVIIIIISGGQAAAAALGHFAAIFEVRVESANEITFGAAPTSHETSRTAWCDSFWASYPQAQARAHAELSCRLAAA